MLEEKVNSETGKRSILKIVLSAAWLVVVLALGGFWYLSRSNNESVDAGTPSQFIRADFVDLDKIYSISKFRSGSGHDFSSKGETCRSMKHYFNVQWSAEGERERMDNNGFTDPPSPGRAIDIFSPVDGEITGVAEEKMPIGSQIYIKPDNAPKFSVRLFHIYPLSVIQEGSKVKAGQKVGEIGLHQNTDIAVEKGPRWNSRFISYFDVMPDNIFAKYQARGVKNRDELIITKEYRDANPLECNGEQFAKNYDSDPNSGNFVYLSGYQKFGGE